jgi:hypothetical protein
MISRRLVADVSIKITGIVFVGSRCVIMSQIRDLSLGDAAASAYIRL